MRGFRITGAKNYTTGTGERSPIESDNLRKTPFFYLDGGGIKIYARSYPAIERVEVVGNYTSPCGAGVSVEHLGNPLDAAVFRDCIFRDHRTQVTGAAFDLLHGSRAKPHFHPDDDRVRHQHEVRMFNLPGPRMSDCGALSRSG